jgi:Family of unknown function (DUF6252)
MTYYHTKEYKNSFINKSNEMRAGFFSLIILSAFFFVSCKKDISELPPAPQTGANTFGCKIDGVFWAPQSFAGTNASNKLEARYGGNNGVFINARNFSSSPTETEFEIYLNNLTGPGVYNLNTATGIFPGQTASYAYYVKRKITPLNEWITNAQNTGTVEITKSDKVNGILSGSFSFTGSVLSGTASVLNVTEGRFDVKVQ